MFDDQGLLILEQAHAFNDSFRTNHIFLKELFAATWAIKALLKRDPGAHEIHIAVDNSAAAAALRHMYSANIIACHELDNLWDILLSHSATLHIHSVRSEDNASDAASRNFDLMLMSQKQRASSTPLGRGGSGHCEALLGGDASTG